MGATLLPMVNVNTTDSADPASAPESSPRLPQRGQLSFAMKPLISDRTATSLVPDISLSQLPSLRAEQVAVGTKIPLEIVDASPKWLEFVNTPVSGQPPVGGGRLGVAHVAGDATQPEAMPPQTPPAEPDFLPMKSEQLPPQNATAYELWAANETTFANNSVDSGRAPAGGNRRLMMVVAAPFDGSRRGVLFHARQSSMPSITTTSLRPSDPSTPDLGSQEFSAASGGAMVSLLQPDAVTSSRKLLQTVTTDYLFQKGNTVTAHTVKITTDVKYAGQAGVVVLSGDADIEVQVGVVACLVNLPSSPEAPAGVSVCSCALIRPARLTITQPFQARKTTPTTLLCNHHH